MEKIKGLVEHQKIPCMIVNGGNGDVYWNDKINDERKTYRWKLIQGNTHAVVKGKLDNYTKGFGVKQKRVYAEEIKPQCLELIKNTKDIVILIQDPETCCKGKDHVIDIYESEIGNTEDVAVYAKKYAGWKSNNDDKETTKKRPRNFTLKEEKDEVILTDPPKKLRGLIRKQWDVSNETDDTMVIKGEKKATVKKTIDDWTSIIKDGEVPVIIKWNKK